MDLPNFKYEKELWKEGISSIGGVDEVGRGCLAGPVLAGVVVFAPYTKFPESIVINDSKKLKPRERARASIWIRENAFGWGIGAGSVGEINNFGIVKATERAMRRAITASKINIEYLFIDAFYLPHTKGLAKDRKQKAIVKGDSISNSIAAASIIAKVERDKIMLLISKNFSGYGWGRNKGYGTREHQNAIKTLGITKHHRTQFVSSFV